MTRTDANQIAFRAVRNLLDGSRPLALVVSGTNVQCAVSRPSARKWPEHPVVGLDEATDGPWPAPVEVTCTWEGGRSTLLVECDFFRSKKKYRHYVGVSLTRGDQEVVWTNVRAALDEAEDGTSVGVVAKASTFKRKRDASDDLGARLNEALHELMTESGLPMLSASTTELCRVDVPSGTIAGGADKAFERLVHSRC